MKLTRILIANRGEIAVRIARACRDTGRTSIAVYSDADAGAMHTALADEALHLPGEAARDTYLNAEALIAAAKRAGAHAVHPGYGFLSENADFARAVEAAGLVWIGPPAQTIDLLGNKVAARELAERVGAPLAAGRPVDDWEDAHSFAEEHGLPVAVKAAFGGGGRGLKIAHSLEEVEAAFDSAVREARAAFGRGECFVEKFLVRPRHVEAQVLADAHGSAVVVGLRDCSLQRRAQKLIEEAPAPFLTGEQERSIIDGAQKICAEAGYVGAGTVEFLVGGDGTVSFLEVNTRLQVEHPVTEETTGIDLVAEQLRIAEGEPLSLTSPPPARGHAFEFRINAEDAHAGFAPSPGQITEFAAPTGPGIRVDAGVRSGSHVPGAYDSLIAKLIVTGADRAQALSRARQALDELTVTGVPTVAPFARAVLDHPDFCRDFAVHTQWIEEDFIPPAGAQSVLADYSSPSLVTVPMTIDGRRIDVGLPADVLSRLGAAPAAGAQDAPAEPDDASVRAPFAGTFVAWKAEDGQTVEAGAAVAVIEAMKMEKTLTAPVSGTLACEELEPGAVLSAGQVLARIDAAG